MVGMERNRRLFSAQREVEHLMRLGYEDMTEENLQEVEDAIYAQAEVIMQE